MVQSMTGFGKAEVQVGNRNFSISLKSVNSKTFDLNLRLPYIIREKENEIRKILQAAMIRGKVDLNVVVDESDEAQAHSINASILSSYVQQLKSAASGVDVSEEELFSIASRMPNVLSQEKSELSDSDWNSVKEAIQKAAEELSTFRTEEGKALKTDLEGRLNNISDNLKRVESMEGERIQLVKDRLNKQLEENGQSDKVNQDRFEQELIYYLEKMDITEEKVRLRSHCNLFLETMNNEDQQGRKLNFISQEIGREINTIGSKANHAEIQKNVVNMKDDLEKIKEQLLNIL